MKYLLASLVVSASALFAESAPDSAALSSANATYDGNTLHLTGHVLLDHGLGKMAAEEAHLQRQEAGKDFPFSFIQLSQNVLLGLKTGAEIRCAAAELDFIGLKGILSSSGEERVVYSDNLKKGLFRLLGKNIELKISKKEGEEKKSDFEIDTILAKEEVSIDFGKGFSLLAHQALFRKSQNVEKPGSEFQGVVTAYPKDENTPCRLIHGDDQIDADSVDLDLVHSKVSLLHPKGALASLLIPGMQKGALQFSSDHLLWDQTKNALVLKGHVNIMESVVGTLVADELEIVETQKKQKQLKTIRTRGSSQINFKDQSGTNHRLIGHGPFLFDREKLHAIFESPKTNGKVPLSKQIYYETEGAGLFANLAHVEYSSVQEHLRPTTLTLTGSVRLFSLDENKPRFALADRLSFSTTTKTAILAANPGKHVLFVDQTQGLRIAAQEIHITRDPKTQEEKIQGVGNILFTFTDEENSLMRKIFPNFKAPE